MWSVSTDVINDIEVRAVNMLFREAMKYAYERTGIDYMTLEIWLLAIASKHPDSVLNRSKYP